MICKNQVKVIALFKKYFQFAVLIRMVTIGLKNFEPEYRIFCVVKKSENRLYCAAVFFRRSSGSLKINRPGAKIANE